MSSVVFKQSYKARASPGVAGLNVRHLQYIATRPGAVYNKGCGFGLWGQLPGDDTVQVQTDLSRAKWLVREASADHTLYRAIISVGREDAEAHGLYCRERWEQLVNDHIHVLAKEMDIKPDDLCLCASMHRSKGHPHVHILYWDNSDRPRNEGIPKHLFEGKAERIRAAFAGDIHREQIQDTQKEQREQTKALRAVLQSMCQEANPEKALDLAKLYRSTELEGVSRQMAELIRQLPAKGSLRYAYLPPDYKKLVDELIDTCLQQPELAKELRHYEALTNRISTLYANGETGKSGNLEKARLKLHKELGNEVMDAIRQIRSEIQEDRPADRPAAQALIREAVDEIVPTLDSYQKLRKLLPPERIPLNCMARQIPGYQEQMNQVIQDVLLDARMRLRLQRYALEQAGIDLDTKPDAPKRKPGEQAVVDGHFMGGKLLTDDEWNAYQDAYREVTQDLRGEITSALRQDAGWTDEAVKTGSAMMLCGMMGLLSRCVNQKQATASQANLLKLLSKDKSKEAKKDAQIQSSQGSEWDPEW